MKEENELIEEMMNTSEYIHLALSEDNEPYCVVVNFVHVGNTLYFHGSYKGRKMRAIKSNPKVSLSLVENHSIIPSYFSSNDKLACPATQFFKSVSMQASAHIVEDKKEKIKALSLLMKKLQPEGGYKPFNNSEYDKMLKITAVVRLDIHSKSIKLKFGQKLNEERFEMVLEHLKERNTPIDLATIEMMKNLNNKKDNNHDT